MNTNHLLVKSQQNRVAFTHLKDVNVFAPSIHCGYYSCLQKIMGILMEYYTDTYEARHKLKGKKGNTHPYYIDEFSDIFYKKCDKHDSNVIRKNLKDLKQFRIDSDYENLQITEAKVNEAEKMINEFHRIVKTHMHL